MAEMRLQKFLARAGVASRRHAEELIAAGRVTVNGARVTEMGVKVDPAANMVAVDGAPVALPEENATFLLHKPAGYVTTMSDPQGRPTVAALMADELLAHPGFSPWGGWTPTLRGFCCSPTTDSWAMGFCTRDATWRRRIWPWWKGCPTRATYGACAKGFCWTMVSRCRRACACSRAPMAAGPHSSSARGPVPAATASATGASAAATRWPPGDLTWKCVCARAATAKCVACWKPWGHPVIALHREAFGPLVLGDLPPGCLASARGRGSGAPQGLAS